MPVGAPSKLRESRNASPGTTDDDGFVRLHISPLDADLLKIVVPASALPSARNISFHTLETFPEKRFGFVELPRTDAEKMKKKLNGTVLKGVKVRIDKARLESRIEPEPHGEENETPAKRDAEKLGDDAKHSKKRKREMGVVDGVMLSDRKVKRGWTEPADKKSRKRDKDDGQQSKKAEKEQKRKQPRSRYIDKEECLLKTRVPPNEMRNLPEEDAGAETKKKKQKNKASGEVTVHEFEKTTKFMSFLRSSAPDTKGKQATEYVEGKGWVDENGDVVEKVKEKLRPKPQQREKTKKAVKQPVESDNEDSSASESDTSADDTSSEESSSDDESEEEDQVRKKASLKTKKGLVAAKDETSDSDASESDTDSSTDDSSSERKKPTNETTGDAKQSKISNSLKIDIPLPPATPKTVHPLEAIFKRSRQDKNAGTTPAAEEKTGFSFFGHDRDDDDDDGDEQMEGGMPTAPMTPYTKQDFEWRNVRSAAPTPDNVHTARRESFFPFADGGGEADRVEEDVEEEEEEEEEEAEEEGGQTGVEQHGTSGFQGWFWENRRDLIRSWMTRRKMAAKEKRYNDNKARASKAA